MATFYGVDPDNSTPLVSVCQAERAYCPQDGALIPGHNPKHQDTSGHNSHKHREPVHDWRHSDTLESGRCTCSGCGYYSTKYALGNGHQHQIHYYLNLNLKYCIDLTNSKNKNVSFTNLRPEAQERDVAAEADTRSGAWGEVSGHWFINTERPQGKEQRQYKKKLEVQ